MTDPGLILETRRLRLRTLEPGDVPALVELWLDADVTRYMGGPRNRESVTANLEADAANPTAEKYSLWPLEEKAGDRLVGHCGVLDKDVDGKLEFELVYVLAKPAWGPGYASEIAAGLRDFAFGKMGLTRLVALIEPENTASEKVALKVGMHLDKEVVRPGGAVRRVYALEAPKT